VLATPSETSGLTITVPLVSRLDDPVARIDALVRALTAFALDPETDTKTPGQHTANTIIANVLAASRLTFEEAQKRPHRLVWPGAAKLTPAELVTTYLADTPFVALFNTPAAIPMPDWLRCEHALVTATIGHGKTQMMQSTIMADLDHPAHPAIVVIDSQGDAINALSRLARFDPDHNDRLIMLDAGAANPPALNLFLVDRSYLAGLTPLQREEFLAGTIEMFEFICRGLLGSELTPRMSTVFRYLAQLLIEIPNATIHTLAALLDDPTPYQTYIERLSPTAQAFLDELYRERSTYTQTRQLIRARVFHILSNPAFERMFSHPTNKVDLRRALDDGKVILVNTSKSQLKAEWSSVFGRYIIAQLAQAAFARAFIPREQRRLALIHIDECHEYLDDSIEQLLIQGRKFATALHLYHQTFDQMQKAGLKATALAIPALRFTGSLNDADARLLAPEMRTSHEFLKSVGKTERAAEWAVYARNLTPMAAKITVPFFAAENAPKMSPAAYERLLARNRARVAAPRRVQRATPQPPPRAAPTNHGDPY
jgi:hypothetical protein